RRYSGQDRFAVGTAAGPIPVDLTTDRAFAGTLRRTHDRMLDAKAHAEITIERIAAELAVPSDPSRHPICQVSFGTEAATGMDLALTLPDPPDMIGLPFARDLYGPASAERLLDALMQVLAHVAADPAMSPRDVSVLPEAERDLVVRHWNETSAPY